MQDAGNIGTRACQSTVVPGTVRVTAPLEGVPQDRIGFFSGHTGKQRQAC